MFKEFIPSWSELLTAFVIFCVPFSITLLTAWIRTKEGQTSGRGSRAEGAIGGGVPRGDNAGAQGQPIHASSQKSGSSKETSSASDQSNSPLVYTGDFENNLLLFKELSADMSDVNMRELRIGSLNLRAVLMFVDGLTDKMGIDQNVIRPLMNAVRPFDSFEHVPEGEELKDIIAHQIVLSAEIECTGDPRMSLQKVLFGSVVLLVEGVPEAIVLGTSKGKTRGVEEPVSEALLRGPRIGFNETLSDNTAMLRRLGQQTELAMISFTVGRRVQKELVMTYIRDIASEELVEEIKRRIRTVDIDDVLESGYLEQLIEDNYLSFFQQVQNTERPDRVMAALLEGRVALLLDGSPFALIVPVTFGMLLQSPEDYYDRWLVGSLIRILRFMAAIIALFAPALYISFLSFHPGMIPTKLAFSIVGSRQGVPFPSLVEALILEVAIEILRESGLRLPKPIGPAMGIVGGLIIGQAAVEAGIVSPILVIVVAVTAISSFAIPSYSAGITLRMLRFIAMFFAGVFGLYGVVLFFLLLSSHLLKLKSFGVPYLSLSVPYRMSDWKDFIIRMPYQLLKGRPTLLKPKDPIRKG